MHDSSFSLLYLKEKSPAASKKVPEDFLILKKVQNSDTGDSFNKQMAP